MPTSSQSLILKYTDAATPLFRQQSWYPQHTWTDPLTRDEHLQNSFLFSKHKRRKKVVQPLVKSRPLHLDFSSLPNLLKINAIRGSFVYDNESNSLKWKISPDSVSDYRYRKTDWSLTPSVQQNKSYVDSSKQLSTLDFIPLLRRKRANENSNLHTSGTYELKSNRKKEHHTFMKIDDVDNRFKLYETTSPEGQYFRLQQTPTSPEGIFHLIKSDISETGSFRLERTCADEAGDFRIVPPDEYETEFTFHLAALNNSNETFRLLQSDLNDHQIFYPITATAQPSKGFVLASTGEHYSKNVLSNSKTAWTDTSEYNVMLDFVDNVHGNQRLYENKENINTEHVELGKAKPTMSYGHSEDNMVAYVKETAMKNRELMKMENVDGDLKLVKVPARDAHYFRLYRDPNSLDGAFQLIQAGINEPGSFRLERTAPSEVGEFRLVPADGHVSDDFRLVTIDASTCSFRLLQSDPLENETYHLVSSANHENGEFRLLQAASREKNKFLSYQDAGPSRAYTVREKYSRKGYLKDVFTDKTDRYDYFRDVVPQFEDNGNASLLPDITLYDSRNHLPFQPQGQSTDSRGHSEKRQMELMSSDNDMDDFRRKYMDTYQAASPEVYNRLVSLGFRPSRQTLDGRSANRMSNEHRQTATASFNHPANVARYGERQDLHGIDWRTHTSQQWSHITNTSEADIPFNLASNLQSGGFTSKTNLDGRRMSLFDEVKLKADYKAWKKKNITTVRMRKDLPPKEPNAVCIKLRDNVTSHERLKRLIEKSAGGPLVSLQFDPVSVHSIDTDAKSQWVLKFENPSICDRLIEIGLPMDGQLLPVRRYDEVMKEEHDAYKYNLILNEMRKRKQERRSAKHTKAKQSQHRKLKSSQTQTGNVSVKTNTE